MAELAECLTLDFSSGNDLRVHEFEPCTGLYADSYGACLVVSLSLSLCPSPTNAVSFSLSLSLPRPYLCCLPLSYFLLGGGGGGGGGGWGGEERKKDTRFSSMGEDLSRDGVHC